MLKQRTVAFILLPLYSSSIFRPKYTIVLSVSMLLLFSEIIFNWFFEDLINNGIILSSFLNLLINLIYSSSVSTFNSWIVGFVLAASDNDKKSFVHENISFFKLASFSWISFWVEILYAPFSPNWFLNFSIAYLLISVFPVKAIK